MYSREELLAAVREAGREGEPFTLVTVRARLGVKTRDRSEVNRFNSRFGSVQKLLGDELEKLGNGRYRLKQRERPRSARDHARQPTAVAPSALAAAASAVAAGGSPPNAIAAASVEAVEATLLGDGGEPAVSTPPGAALAARASAGDAAIPEARSTDAAGLAVAPATHESPVTKHWRDHGRWLWGRFAPLFRRERARFRVSPASMQRILERLRVSSRALRARCSAQLGALRARASRTSEAASHNASRQ